MALCRRCGKEIQETVHICPHCSALQYNALQQVHNTGNESSAKTNHSLIHCRKNSNEEKSKSIVRKFWTFLKNVIQFIALGSFGYIVVVYALHKFNIKRPYELLGLGVILCIIIIIALGLWFVIQHLRKNAEYVNIDLKSTSPNTFKKVLIITANIPPLLGIALWPFVIFLSFFLGNGVLALLLFWGYPFIVLKGVTMTYKALLSHNYRRCVKGTILAYSYYLFGGIPFCIVRLFYN